jgi:hypothetical protein
LPRLLSALCSDIAPHFLAPPPFQGILIVEPQIGKAAATHQTLDDRLSGFAGRGFAANTNVAIAHDCNPSSGDMRITRNCSEKLHALVNLVAGASGLTVFPYERPA